MPTILIVDADVTQRRLIRRILSEDPSFTFLEACDESQARHLTQLHHPDTLILDLGALSPDYLRSDEARRIARSGRFIPVIFTATWSDTNTTLITIFASGRSVLFKPFEARELRAAVYHALKRTRLPARVS